MPQNRFSLRDMTYTRLIDGFTIVAVTDVPCHLYMRWTTTPPQIHTIPVLRRGLFMHDTKYFCFVAWTDNEQEEAGDTLIHTFIKHNWPICQTRYFYFWATIGGVPSVSTTAIFQLHFTAPPLFTGMPLWHNRIVLSNHGTWALARNGINEAKYGFYQRPQSIQRVETWLTVSYFIIRAYQNFDTLDVPSGKTIVGARLGIYVTLLEGLIQTLFITKGLWDEPVTEEDFGLQTNETTILGQIDETDLVVGRYNWIDLNSVAIAWINQRLGERNQYESYDWQKTAYFDMYGNAWQSQTFTPQNTHTLTSLKLRIKKKGSPGHLYVVIKRADASHNPTGPALASGTVHPNLISTDTWGDWCFVGLGDGFVAEAGIEYCIECHLAGGNASNCVQWIGATATLYPNGYHSISANGGSSWTSYSQYSTYFIEYSSDVVGGTKFCLRTDYDLNNSPPTIGVDHRINYYSAQKGEGYQPLLELILD